ncbi:EXOSX protein, partial [Polypterus senegalus]
MAALLGAGDAPLRKTSLTTNEEANSEKPDVFPGFKDADSFVKYGLANVLKATKASAQLPQAGDEYDFYRSFPGFQAFCETQGERLLKCMSQIMKYHGCKNHMRERNKVTGLEERFDLLVDSNDVILEKVGILLDEASGVHRTQQPVLPAGVQAPKMIVSSWNRKGREPNQRSKSGTFHLLHAKNIQRPQIRFKEKVDNSNTPFAPKIFVKPNALKPLPSVLVNRRIRDERPEDLDVPAALADFIHQQRHQNDEQELTAHPYQYELDHFTPHEKLICKPDIQMYKPLLETSCHLINTLDDLVELNEKLAKSSEFAVDLEVFHGADSDIEWLQRDFGLYIVNLFDTHQAARILNLGRNSLEHLLRLYCNVECDKRYQLADWRIRPLPEEMVQYAREDTHYLLYIYDRMRADLLERGNDMPTLVHLVWQKSKDISLKKYVKPIFTEHSYLELYKKQKKLLNTQQLTALRLLYRWRDQIARQEDESTGEPQGILACCNPVPPLVKQQLNELHLLVQQSRDIPLLKSDSQLFGPHDVSRGSENETSFSPTSGKVEQVCLSDTSDFSTVPNVFCILAGAFLKRSKLFSDEVDVENQEEKIFDDCPLLASASITIFDDCDSDVKQQRNLTVSQQKARHIMESFENPFRMYLPAKDNNIHISQNAKFDPSSKAYEIRNKWKLLSMEQQQKDLKSKEKAKKAAREASQKAIEKRKAVQESYKSSVEDVKSVRQQAATEALGHVEHKQERQLCDPEVDTTKPDKKRMKQNKAKVEQQPQADFKPFDYSQSDLSIFTAGKSAKSKGAAHFDPNRQDEEPKKGKKKKIKNNLIQGNKSMTYLAGASGSKTYGNVLVLDGVIQCTERDEFSYQEMIANLPLCSHPNPKKVLIIGGGDGGVLREVIKHRSVESVVQCEIDEDVINVSKKFLPEMAKGFFSPKLTLNVGDGFEFMKQNQDAFDVIITDSSDPVGECQWLHLDLIKEMRTFCKSLFPVVDYAYCTIPTYPSGQIGFMLCSKNPETNFRQPERQLTSEEVESMNLKYYNSEIHKAAFVLPEFARKDDFGDQEEDESEGRARDQMVEVEKGRLQV